MSKVTIVEQLIGSEWLPRRCAATTDEPLSICERHRIYERREHPSELQALREVEKDHARVMLKLHYDGETTRLDPNANGAPIGLRELDAMRARLAALDVLRKGTAGGGNK